MASNIKRHRTEHMFCWIFHPQSFSTSSKISLYCIVIWTFKFIKHFSSPFSDQYSLELIYVSMTYTVKSWSKSQNKSLSPYFMLCIILKQHWSTLNCPFYIANIVLSWMNRVKSSCRRTDAQKRTFSLPESVGNKTMDCVIKTATSVPNDIPLFSSKWQWLHHVTSTLPLGFVF